MKGEMFDSVRKHNCANPGSPWLGFAPLDVDVMKTLVERDASSHEVQAQVKISIADDAAKNPKPTEPEVQRFREAILSNNPFVVYCGRCLGTICLIHPEEVKEERVADEHESPSGLEPRE